MIPKLTKAQEKKLKTYPEAMQNMIMNSECLVVKKNYFDTQADESFFDIDTAYCEKHSIPFVKGHYGNLLQLDVDLKDCDFEQRIHFFELPKQ